MRPSDVPSDSWISPAGQPQWPWCDCNFRQRLCSVSGGHDCPPAILGNWLSRRPCDGSLVQCLIQSTANWLIHDRSSEAECDIGESRASAVALANLNSHPTVVLARRSTCKLG